MRSSGKGSIQDMVLNTTCEYFFSLFSARQRYMFELYALMKRDYDKLAAILTLEHGKTTTKAKGDVYRSL